MSAWSVSTGGSAGSPHTQFTSPSCGEEEEVKTPNRASRQVGYGRANVRHSRVG